MLSGPLITFLNKTSAFFNASLGVSGPVSDAGSGRSKATGDMDSDLKAAIIIKSTMEARNERRQRQHQCIRLGFGWTDDRARCLWEGGMGRVLLGLVGRFMILRLPEMSWQEMQQIGWISVRAARILFFGTFVQPARLQPQY